LSDGATVDEVCTVIRALALRAVEEGRVGVPKDFGERFKSEENMYLKLKPEEINKIINAGVLRHTPETQGLKAKFVQRSTMLRHPGLANFEATKSVGNRIGHFFKKVAFGLTAQQQARKAGIDPVTLEPVPSGP
jgi:hypothetical protein